MHLQPRQYFSINWQVPCSCRGYLTENTQNVAIQSCKAEAKDVAGGLMRHRLSKWTLQVPLPLSATMDGTGLLTACICTIQTKCCITLPSFLKVTTNFARCYSLPADSSLCKRHQNESKCNFNTCFLCHPTWRPAHLKPSHRIQCYTSKLLLGWPVEANLRFLLYFLSSWFLTSLLSTCTLPRATEHILGHIGDGFYGSNDRKNSVKALKEDKAPTTRPQSNQVEATVLQ